MVTKGLAGTIGQPDRIYAIGDVHGHLDQLQALHATIKRDLQERPARQVLLVHLGDYVDRGPDSAGCIALLAAGSPIEGADCVNLMGNHERMLLDALERPADAPLWLHNGGITTLQSWGLDPDAPHATWKDAIPVEHLHFLQTLALKHVVEPYLFVHAGVRPGVRLSMQSASDLLWIREAFLEWHGPMLPDAPSLRIVHGHTPSAEPDLHANRLGIDTNAARGGKLTCAALSSDFVYFLQA